jgi:hypothetical protein
MEDSDVQNNQDQHRLNQSIFQEEWLQADQKLRDVMNISGTGNFPHTQAAFFDLLSGDWATFFCRISQ